jgi:hypothetical protein
VEEALDPPAGPEDEAKAIGFGTFLDRVPQNGIKPLANVMDIGKLKGQGFMVEAYQHATTNWSSWNDGARTATPNFMSAQTVTWSGDPDDPGTWTYSPIRYWPRSSSSWSNVTFFAYTSSPNTATIVTFAPAGATNENPQLHYNMSPNSARQTDLIVDAAYNVTHDTDNGKVKFKFDHILSRIGFQAKIPESHYGATSITITYLNFYYRLLHTSGTYTFNSGTGDGSDKNNKAGKWDVTGSYQTTTPEVLFSGPVLLKTDPYNLSEHLKNPNRYLMLIPQANAVKQAYVEVSYTIRYPPGTIPLTQDYKEQAYLPETIWKPGIAYTYTLNIAPKAVEIDVEEAKWNDWEDVDPPIDPIDVP